MTNTLQRLREEMDKLALAQVEEANKLKGKENSAVKLAVLKHVTAYLSMTNRQPEESVGADIVNFQRRIAGADTGRGSGGGPDGGADQAGADSDEGDGGESEATAA